MKFPATLPATNPHGLRLPPPARARLLSAATRVAGIAMAAPPDRSDLDFADVFGGPPRRSSGNDRLRRSSMDSSFGSASRGRSGTEERFVFGERTSSGSASMTRSGGESGPGERPVFGERTSSERRQLGQEFYRDIFPGGESLSPRRGGASGDRDVFGAPASPGSTSRLRSRYLV